MKTSFTLWFLLSTLGGILLGLSVSPWSVSPGERVTVFGIGAVFLVLSATFWFSFMLQVIDGFERMVKNSKSSAADAAAITAGVKFMSGELRDINRHVCDGFNGIAEIVSDQRAA